MTDRLRDRGAHQRLVPRYEIVRPCQIHLLVRSRLLRRRIERVVDASLVDVSVSGAAIAVARPDDIDGLAERKLVTIVVGTATIAGRIRHVEHSQGAVTLGVEFIDIGEQFQQFFNDLVGQSRDAGRNLRDQWEGAS